MGTLEITVRVEAAGRWPVVAEYTADDDPLPLRAEGVLLLNLAAIDALAADVQPYGEALGKALFDGPIRRAFDGALARSGADSLRLLLFVEDGQLAQLRWERLCAPLDGGWQPLATSQQVPLSRYVPSQADRRFPPIGRHNLRALIVAASPAQSVDWGLAPFDEATAIAGVVEALTAAQVPFTLLSTGPGGAGPPTLDAICELITREGVTLLHIVAHGRAIEDGAVLYLSHADNQTQVDPVTATRLIDRLNNLNGPFGLPHLTYFSTCESAKAEHNGAFGGLGQQLVMDLGTPAVVAMADKVSVATASALAAAFYGQLLEAGGEAEGAVDLALVRATAGLAERPDITVPVVFSRLGARPLFSGATQRAPSAAEVEAGLGALAKLVAERAPVLRPELQQAAALVRAHLGGDEAALSADTRRDLQQARATIEAICSEAAEITFSALATGTAPPHYEGATCPFPGLATFTEQQQRFFFGRDQLVQELLGHLERRRFLAVAGSSGSGKSSLVLAGLMPMLRTVAPGTELAYLTPGELPLAALERELYAAQSRGAREVVVVIDQFEELFLLGAGEAVEREERVPFIKRLGQVAAEHRVIISVRSDFLDECGRYAALNGLLTGNTVQIQPLSAEELREAAERQAATVGLRFEAGLTEIILDDVRGERSVMPLAQHALRELWQRRRGRWLRTSEYVDLGGIREAIARTADQIFARHDEESRERLREIFLRLTRVDRDPSEGEEPADTRQRVSIADLVPAGASAERIGELVHELGEARLVIQDGELVEVAHEAIIRHWRRLRQWLDDDRQLLIRLDDLRQATAAWQRGDEAEYFLWAGGRLSQAEALAQLPRFRLNAQEQRFLEASLQARQREQEAQLAQLKQERELRAAAEQAGRLAAEAQRLAEQREGEARRAQEQAIVQRTRAEENQKLAVEQANEATAQRDRARAEQERATLAEANVRAKALQLQRSLLIVVGLAAIAGALAFLAVAQSNASRRQALIAEAQAALARGDTDGALALALTAPSDRRLTSVLAAAANTGARRIHDEFEDTVTSAAFSADGATYMAASHDGRLLIWDRASGTIVRDYRYGGDPANIIFAVFAGDEPVIGTLGGELVAISASDGEAFSEPSGELWSLVASPDGALLLSGDLQGGARLWDVESRTLLRTLYQSPEPTRMIVALLDGGRTAAVGDGGGSIRIFDTESGEERGSFELRQDDRPDSDDDLQPDPCFLYSLAALPSPDGELLLAGCDDGAIEAWSAEGVFLGEFQGHDAPVLTLAPLPGGDGFVSSSYDHSVRVWDYETGRWASFFQGHTGEVYGLAVSPDGEQLLSGSFDGTARLWDLRGGLRAAEYLPAEGDLNEIVALRPGADGRLVAADITGALASWQLEDGSAVAQREAPGEPLALSGDGRRALVRLPNGEVAFWDVAAHTAISSFAAELPDQAVAALNGDGSTALVALASGDSELRASDGALLHTFGAGDGVASAFAFSPDSSRALIGYFDRTMGLWSIPEGARIGDWLKGHDDYVTSLAFSPDGTRAISGAWDKTARIWDLERRGEPLVLRGHRRTVSAVAFSPDGRLALTGSFDYSVKLWEVGQGLELISFGDHQSQVMEAAFSPDGRSVVSGTITGEVTRWMALVDGDLLAWLRENRALP